MEMKAGGIWIGDDSKRPCLPDSVFKPPISPKAIHLPSPRLGIVPQLSRCASEQPADIRAMRGIVSEIQIPAGPVTLEGELMVPPDAKGRVLFAHGSGSGRHSPRNQFVASQLQDAAMATLLFDLLTTAEEQEDYYTGHLRFDIERLAGRRVHA